MRHQRLIILAAVCWALGGFAPPWMARAGTFGEVVAIGGQASDIALDEPRGVLYIANFTAGRIDVLSLADRVIRTSMHVAAGPSSLSLSRDGRFLAVTHFGNLQAPASPANAITVLDLVSGVRQSFALPNPPLGVAFGSDGMALIATTGEFLLLDPSSGRTTLIDTVAKLTANSIPAAPGTPPVQVIAASMAVSGDGRWVAGLADTIRFTYDVSAKRLKVVGYTAVPALGPRVVSVASDGSYYAAGWGIFDRSGPLRAQFANASGLLAVGSHAIDSAGGTIYAQIPETSADPSPPPILTMADADNLTVRERFNLAENLSGRSLLNAAGDTMYAVSESGVMILPVGSLSQTPRLSADREDLVFRGSFCQHGAVTQSFRVFDPGGGHTSFALTADLAGVNISPASGRTPLTVQVTIDPGAYRDRRGTVVGSLKFTSPDAVNLPLPVRILVTNQRPDERGSSMDVPGTLSDLLADPDRDRFYVLRQDRNQVLVFEGSGPSQVAALRTSNTPTGLALTFDRKYLLIGHENSQLVYVYDLDTLQQSTPITLPPGHYPRSIAASANAILAASRVAGTVNTIDRLDFASRTSSTLPSLGVFENAIAADTVLLATPDGGQILSASADGLVFLYDAGDDTFTVSRKVAPALSGSYATSGWGEFAVGNYLLNGSLRPIQTWSGSDFPSGLAFVDGDALRLTGPASATGAGGSVQRFDSAGAARSLPTRVAEQPLASGSVSAFTRTLAPLANRNTIIALTVSGITALAWRFDAAVAPPVIDRVVNAADLTAQVAPGSLIAVFGSNLNPTNIATAEIPLPTAIGESCLSVNGSSIPMMFASPGQINAQLPLHMEGRVAMTLYTPGGVSDDYYLQLLPAAPAIFHSGSAGPLTGLPVVIKERNQQLVTPSNPLHHGDEISIYATGLGPTSPEVAAGASAPGSPPALTVSVPEVRLANVPLTVSYSGLAAGQVGVYQINARVPDRVGTGVEVPLTVIQGGATTSITVRVVD